MNDIATSMPIQTPQQVAPIANTKYREKFASNIVEFFQAVQTLSSETGTTWFRGHSKRTYRLEPGLYRHSTIKNNPDPHGKAEDLESKLIERFKNQSVPYVGNKFSHEDEWAQLFFMQHYRVPTRLLDWSYSPLIALHFALSGASTTPNDPESACTVWVLHPEIWNGAALSHQRADSIIYGTESDKIKYYKAKAAFSVPKADAVAIEGIHNSPRIVAQQGAFTVFGSTTSPMEEQFLGDKYPSTALSAISIKSKDVERLNDELVKAGILETTVYPDLEGLAHRLKRELAF